MKKFIVRSRLNEVMKEKGIQSQKELAELVGTTEATISRFKTNTRYDITTLFIISRGLNVPIEELFHVEEIEEGKEKLRGQPESSSLNALINLAERKRNRS